MAIGATVPFGRLLEELGQFASTYLGLLRQSSELRWLLAGVIWLALTYRFFGRGVGKGGHGLLNWYDWLVIVGGSIFIWVVQFGPGVG